LPKKTMKNAMKKATKKTTPRALHAARFPGESRKYRAARDQLLKSEIVLRRQTEAVAAARRRLPLGGALREDYVFASAEGPVRFSDLFAPGKDTLLVYSFMFGPQMKAACPSCTSILDSVDGAAPHVAQRASLVVVAKSPIDRITSFARERGWHRLRLLSSEANSYNHDYHGEDDRGAQLPMMNVFTRRDGRIYHTWASEMLFAATERGEDGRHVDSIWPLWNLFDLTAEGRGTTWYPKLRYD
jgi:predicted dithiol-disulfide oxidoreductase (DUF899 family)